MPTPSRLTTGLSCGREIPTHQGTRWSSSRVRIPTARLQRPASSSSLALPVGAVISSRLSKPKCTVGTLCLRRLSGLRLTAVVETSRGERRR